MKHFVFARYSALGCRKPTQTLSARPAPQPVFANTATKFPYFTPDGQRVLSQRNLGARNHYKLPQIEPGLSKLSPLPHLIPQFQRESKSFARKATLPWDAQQLTL